MLSLTNLLALSPILANIATALPWVGTTADLHARAETNILAPPRVGVYMCVDADWKGHCEHLLNAPGLCIDLPQELAGQVSAVGPDKQKETFASGCTLFKDIGCKGEYMADIAYPGLKNLAQAPLAGAYNDFFKSYICY
ncbi:hypothetical protein M409DRAFT_15925 [Zasmidium cellare ATCC 36951]|uniref:Uncharacterized protein n=1 Tax=Zasmidium cellare ATCC 36951 TaxID=1080233 RepID=A0A6A6D2L2_ZASCE|nr:uncharacterized protein M409DRAFT_15925 [Zasmidium cellare ATCC 36951]KAF2173647.1 hypothetical protein M409DRAFT_15925 [Zasmidium cellare ATCC 36951]